MPRIVNLGDYYGTIEFPDGATDADVIAKYDELEAGRLNALKASRLNLAQATEEVERNKSTLGKLAELTGINIAAGAGGATRQLVGNAARTYADIMADPKPGEGFGVEQALRTILTPTIVGGYLRSTASEEPEAPVNILREAGKSIADDGSEQFKEAARRSEEIGGGLPGKIVAGFASTAGASAPALLAAPFGLGALAAASGAQGYGSSASQFKGRLMELNPEMTEEEAFQKAQGPAAAVGVVSGVLTRTFGGVERFMDHIVKNGLKTEGTKALLKQVTRSAIHEAPEEWFQSLAEDFTEKAYVDPNKDMSQIWNKAGMSALTGVSLGLGTSGSIAGVVKGGEAVAGAVERSKVRRQSAQDSEARVKQVVQERETQQAGTEVAKTGTQVAETGTKPVETGTKEAGFGGYQFNNPDLPQFTIPGARPGIVRHVSAETAQKAGYTVPAAIPTMEEWQAGGSPTVAPATTPPAAGPVDTVARAPAGTPQNPTPIQIQKLDGTVVNGVFTGYVDWGQYGGIKTSVGTVLPDGKMSHGFLDTKRGDKILTEIPSYEQWSAAKDTQAAPAIPTTPQQQAQAPINWQAFATMGKDGYNVIDPAKIRQQVIAGKIQGDAASNQLLLYLLKDSNLHPLNPIRLIDLGPQQLKEISDPASPAGQGAYRGLFTTRTLSNRGNIEVLLKNSDGTPVSQALFVSTLIHELAHNAFDSKLGQASPELRQEAQDIFDFVRQNSEGTAWASSNAISNIREFFAELTDPQFQRYLGNLNYGQTGKANIRKSVLTTIYDFIRRVLGLPEFITSATGEKVMVVTALEQAFSTAGQLEQVQRESQAALMSRAPAEENTGRPAFFSTRQEVEAMAANPGLDPAQQQEVRDLAAVQSSMSPDSIVGFIMSQSKNDAERFAKKRIEYVADRRYLSDIQQNLASMPAGRAKEVAGAIILGHHGVDRNVRREIDTDFERARLQMAEAAPKLAGMDNERLKAGFLTSLFNHLTSDYRVYLNNLASSIPANENAQAQYQQRLVNAERHLNEHQQSPIAVQHAMSAIASTMPTGLTTNQQVVDWALQQNVLNQNVVGNNVRSWLLVDDGGGAPALLGYTRFFQDMSDLQDVLAHQNDLATDIDGFEQWFRTSGKTGKVSAKAFAEKYFSFRTQRNRALKVAAAIDKEIGDLGTRIYGNMMARDQLDTMMSSRAYVDTVRDAKDRAHVVVRAIMDSEDGKTGNGLIDRESNVGIWRMKGPMTGADYVVDINPSTAQEAQNIQALSAFVDEAIRYSIQNRQTDPLLADQYSDLADYIKKYLLHPSLNPSNGFVQMPWMQIPGTTIRLTADPFDWASSGLTMIGFTNRTVRDAIERIGGRPVRQAMSDAYELDRVMRKVQGLEANPKFGFDAQTRAVIAAIKSHGWTMDQFSQWDEMVAEKFLSSGQNNLGAKYNIGEVLVGSEGVRLTREDIAALKLMKKFSSAVQAAAPAHIEENIGNLGVLRKAVGFGEYTMARLPQSWTHTFVTNWNKLPDDAAKLGSLQIGRDFSRVVMGYIGEFNPELNKMNPASSDKSPLFDIYRKMALQEKQGVRSFSNLDEVLDFIADEMVTRNMAADRVTARADAQEKLFAEVNGFIKAFQSNVLNQKTDAVWNGKPDPVMQIATANNSFMTPRGTLQAPSTFYSYSIATDGRRRGHVGGLRSLLNLKVIQSMREALSAMRNKKSEMQDKIEEQIRAGIPASTAKKNVVKQTSKERRAGEIRFDYREIDTAARYLSSVLEQMERVEVSNPDHYQHPGIEAVQNVASTLKSGLLASTQAISTNTWGGLLLGPAVLHWQTGQWGRAMRDILPFPVGGNARVTETLFKMVSSMVASNPIMAKLLKKHAPLWNSLSEIIVNASADWARVHRTAQRNGMVSPANVWNRISNQWNLTSTAGRFTGEADQGATATFFNTILSAPGINWLVEPVKAIFPRKFDDFINHSLILGFDKDLDMLKKRGWDAFKKREDAAVPGYDWKNLSDPANILTPEEMGIGSNKGLNRWQELFAPLGSLDSVLLDYYERTKSMTPEEREATPLIPDENDYAGLALYYAAVSNVATETNRPQSYKGRGSEGFLRSTAGTFAGWGANFMHQLSKGLQTYSKDPQYNRIANNMLGLAVIFILMASIGAWNWEFGDELTKLITNKSSARIQIGNADEDPRTAMGYVAQALVNVVPVAGPIIGSLAGLAFTGRGSPLDATSQILHLNFASDTYKTAKRILQTGDVTLPMADWTRRWVFPPLTGAIMNRMPVLRGIVDQQNAIRSLNGSAPPGTEIKWGRGSGEMRYGPANDEIMKLIASAYEAVAHGGSLAAVEQRRAEAVAAFVKTGRSEEDAIKAVDAALASKEPIRVLTGKEFTEEESARWIARMTPNQKKDYDRAAAAFELLGSVTGKDFNMVAQERGSGGGGIPSIAGIQSGLGPGIGSLTPAMGLPASAGYLRMRQPSYSGMRAGTGSRIRSPMGRRRSAGRLRRIRTSQPRRRLGPRVARSRVRSVLGSRRRRSYASA